MKKEVSRKSNRSAASDFSVLLTSLREGSRKSMGGTGGEVTNQEWEERC